MIRKTKHCTWYIWFVITIAALSACEKDEFSGKGATVTDFVTIYAQNGHPSSLAPDRGGATLYITKSAVNKRELTHQRRVIATYTYLKNVTPKNLCDHTFWNVRLDKIMDLTCKYPVLKSQTEDPDQLGTGVLQLNNFKLTFNYLNVEYEHPDVNPDINLWFDDTNHPASKTLTFLLCINSPVNTAQSKTKGYVSFDVSKLFSETRDYFYALKDDNWGPCGPDKLILRYYESAETIKELRFSLFYSEMGISLQPENS